MKSRLLVFSADAMIFEDYTYLMTRPNFSKYIGGKCGVNKVTSIYPTLTYPAHTTIQTGCWPEKTGIINNLVYSEDPKNEDWEWFADNIKVPGIFEAAKEAGYTTGAVFWPVTGNNKSIDWLINEYCLPKKGETLDTFLEMGTNEETLQVIKDNEAHLPGTYIKTGLENFAIHPYCDMFCAACSSDIIRRFKPEVMFLHTCPVDGMRHAYGAHSQKLYGAIDLIDWQLGQVCEALEDAGVLGETNICFISDHGHKDIDKAICPNIWFKENGLLTSDGDGNLIDWEAMCQTSGMSAYIYLKNPENVQVREQVKALLEEKAKTPGSGVSVVFTKNEIKEKYHIDGTFSFMIEGDDRTEFKNNVDGEVTWPIYGASEKYAHGSHGYLPEKGPHPFIWCKGPAFKDNAIIENAKLVDFAPTFAKVLGIKLPEADGRVLTELLK